MARGKPALWSALVALPFVASGVALFLQEDLELPGLTLAGGDLVLVGASLTGFGAFVVLLGLYVQFVSPSDPSLRDGEEIVDRRHPSQRVALTKVAVGVPLLCLAAVLLFGTRLPYVYPTVALAAGLYFLSSGLKTYWINTLTVYLVTTDRVISRYRFVSLRQQEIPLDKVRGVEERRSPVETLVGLGNIRVASSGGGGSVRIAIRNVRDSTGFADELRDLM